MRFENMFMIGSITIVLFLVYMIKPAPANIFCDEWSADIDGKFGMLENATPSEEAITGWMNTQRETLIYYTMCYDFNYLFGSA